MPRANTEGLRVALRAFAVDVAVNAERALQTAVKVGEGAAKATDTWKDGEENNPDGSPRRQGVHTRETIEGAAAGFRGFLEAQGAARFLEWGTAPHQIHVRWAKFLRFWSGGAGPFFRRSVNHPGTAATFFLGDAGQEAKEFLVFRLRANVREALRRYKLGG